MRESDNEALKIKASALSGVLGAVLLLVAMTKCGGTDKERIRADAEVQKACIAQGCSWTFRTTSGGFAKEVCLCGCCPNSQPIDDQTDCP